MAFGSRQVIAAIAIGAVRGIAEHKFLALRAIAVGWIALLLFFALAGDVLAGGGGHWISYRIADVGLRTFGAETWPVVRFLPPWFCGFFIVPHALFYVIFTALPFFWWAGFVLVPLLILLAGLCGTTSVREAANE